MKSFFPQDYEPPATSGGSYLKLKDGETRIRILSDAPTIGWEYWSTANKPVRHRVRPSSTPADIRINDEGEPDRIKEFYVFVVWDYAAEALAILSVTQASIKQAIRTFAEDEDWGHPSEYDIKITRKGKGLDTEYTVVPAAKKPYGGAIAEEWEAKGKSINLDALFDGLDPFTTPKSNHARIRELLDRLGVVDEATRNETAKTALSGRKPSELTEQQLDDVLATITLMVQAEAENTDEILPVDDEIPF